ncbi:MAG: hypothetical protein V4736_02925 [Bdellovibrionota bacterium]
MKHIILSLSLILSSVALAQSCVDAFTVLKNFRTNSFEELNIPGKIKIGEWELTEPFKTAINRPEIKQYLDQSKNTQYKLLGEAKLPPEKGGGRLRLVSLNITNGNRAYNHQELVALLHVNPRLANELGMYRVEGYENIVWVPDEATVNFRLKALAQKRGFPDAIWKYGTANGVVATMPYLKLLADGKFPFSVDSDINLSIHDGMHAIAFGALNSTPHSRKVMEAALSRNKVLMSIHARIQNEMPGKADQLNRRLIDNHASMLSPDSMERTMLLTILFTGNYGYFSPSEALAGGSYSKLKNREITKKRLEVLLKYFNNGSKTFKPVMDDMVSSLGLMGNPIEKAKLKSIITEEVGKLKKASDADIEKASDELFDFFRDDQFTDEPQTYTTDAAKGITPSPTDPSLKPAEGPEL